MFGLFGNQKTKLERQYKRLQEESYRLSHVDRKQSDLKAAEADEIRKQIEALEQG